MYFLFFITIRIRLPYSNGRANFYILTSYHSFHFPSTTPLTPLSAPPRMVERHAGSDATGFCGCWVKSDGTRSHLCSNNERRCCRCDQRYLKCPPPDRCDQFERETGVWGSLGVSITIALTCILRSPPHFPYTPTPARPWYICTVHSLPATTSG